MKGIQFLVALFLFIQSQAYSQIFPTGFSRVKVGSTLTNPTVMAFAPDGRIFVAEQSGTLRVIKNDALLATPFVSLTVNSNGERGLIGIAFDPDFATNNFLYLYYTVNTPPIHNRISRFTANGDVVVAGSELIILELDNLSGATNHNGGALAFGLDGKLYVAIGENANTSHAQNLDTYHGKMLRINKDGSAPTDNPFYSTVASEQKKRVWSYGLRNPYTFSIQPITGKIFVNDVGQSTWEEINDASAGGRNFGWPATEGATTNPSFTTPVYSYRHSNSIPKDCAITGGTFFNPATTNYPSTYIGKYFFQDYCSNWIYYIDPTQTSPTATLFGSSVGGTSLSITAGPDGNLYYLSRGSNLLYRLVYTPQAIAPTISSQPSTLNLPVGQSATFSVTANGTAPLSYQWRKNGANINLATLSSYTINPTQLSDAGNYSVVVGNSVGSVTSTDAVLTITSPNQPPTAFITSPTKNTLYTAGTAINFSGNGTDSEQGSLLASAFSWQINFHHDTHVHDQPALAGIKSGTFDVPNQGETSDNVWYRFILTVTDDKGATSKDSVDVYPQKSKLNFETNPPGLKVLLDGQPLSTPASVTSVVGILREIRTTSQTFNNIEYEFSSWSIGGAVTQTIPTPANDATYKANFSPVLGVEDLTDGNRLSVSPNPTFGDFTIHVHSLVEETIDLQICDLLSRKLWSKEVKMVKGENKIQATAEGLAHGINLVILTNVDGRSVVRKIIVLR
jgi:glucose/arabinose dehydrogenase